MKNVYYPKDQRISACVFMGKKIPHVGDMIKNFVDVSTGNRNYKDNNSN